MAPLTASTNTTSPTSETTYLANRPSRRNQILSLTPIIQTLGRIRNELPRRRRFRPPPVQMAIPAGTCLAQFGGIFAFQRYWRLNNCRSTSFIGWLFCCACGGGGGSFWAGGDAAGCCC